MSGGTSAPGGRRTQLRAALGQGQPRGPRGRSEIPGTVKPMPFPRIGGTGVQRKQNIGPIPKLGAQLQARVQSGAIDRKQALQTARQRQTLKKAFGSDWRSKVFAGSGVKEIRQGGPFANRMVTAERAKGLARAKRKLY